MAADIVLALEVAALAYGTLGAVSLGVVWLILLLRRIIVRGR